MYSLYVIPGSHACRSAMLMLDHKRVPWRRVDVVTVLHPLAVRLLGFEGGRERRTAGGRRPLALRMGDHLGTVPALAMDGERVSTNRLIARVLDERHPDRPLFPADPEKRRAVEEVERWANDPFQMAARRILAAAVGDDIAAFSRSAANGRMGHLLYKHALTRRLVLPRLARFAFAVDPGSIDDILADLHPMLDKIDGWIAGGILGGEELNVADFMIAPGLALILYWPDVLPAFEGRPALELVDRLLPEPASAAQPS